MSDIPFTYDEHVATFRRLVADINTSLTREDRERLVAFTALEADADVFGIPGLEKLPAIISVRTSFSPAAQHADPRLAERRVDLHADAPRPPEPPPVGPFRRRRVRRLLETPGKVCQTPGHLLLDFRKRLSKRKTELRVKASARQK